MFRCDEFNQKLMNFNIEIKEAKEKFLKTKYFFWIFNTRNNYYYELQK